MRDIVIKSNIVERELFILLGCTIAAFLVSIYALINYNANWIEFFTTIHYTLLLALVFYLIAGIFRLMIIGVMRLVKKSNA